MDGGNTNLSSPSSYILSLFWFWFCFFFGFAFPGLTEALFDSSGRKVDGDRDVDRAEIIQSKGKKRRQAAECRVQIAERRVQNALYLMILFEGEELLQR